MCYDIIGDIHGHVDPLKKLLARMGYREVSGVWQHSERQAIFLGDFVDRGPAQKETINLVRRMNEAGSAQAVLGNHEFNAIAWFLPDPECPGEYLRPHFSKKYGEKNRMQHAAFLAEFEGKPDHQETIEWFLSLPLYLDLPALRVVHACWHQHSIDFLQPYLTAQHTLTRDAMIAATREPVDEAEKNTPDLTIFKAVEILLKGFEIPLPKPHVFIDKDGHVRHRVRVSWWNALAKTYREAALVSEDERKALPELEILEHVRIGHDGKSPIFVGHYWLTGDPILWSNKIACLDYSVAAKGQLVAYRWDGEDQLDASKLVGVRA